MKNIEKYWQLISDWLYVSIDIVCTLHKIVPIDIVFVELRKVIKLQTLVHEWSHIQCMRLVMIKNIVYGL